jgi:hypothetical protein
MGAHNGGAKVGGEITNKDFPSATTTLNKELLSNLLEQSEL